MRSAITGAAAAGGALLISAQKACVLRGAPWAPIPPAPPLHPSQARGAVRVVHLLSSYPPETLGGTEVYVDGLTTALRRRGIDASVAYHLMSREAGSQSFGYPVERLPPRGAPSRRQLYEGRLGEPPEFRALLEHVRPDILHFHAYTLGAGADHADVAKSLGIPYVVTYHTPTMSCPRGTLLRWGQVVCDGRVTPSRCAPCKIQSLGVPRIGAEILASLPFSGGLLTDTPLVTAVAMRDLIRRWRACWFEFMKGAAHVIACATWCRDVLVANDLSPEDVSVIRQAVPVAASPSVLRLPLAAGPLRFGFLGRVTRDKAPDHVIAAISSLRASGIDAHCELVGPVAEGDRAWLEDLLASESAARHLGVKRGEARDAWLRSLDALVLPGVWLETGPLVLLEAWSLGVPVLGVSLGGVKEFFTEAGLQALLFAPHDVASLVAAIERARSWRGDAPSVKIQDLPELALETEAVYQRILRRKNKTSP